MNGKSISVVSDLASPTCTTACSAVQIDAKSCGSFGVGPTEGAPAVRAGSTGVRRHRRRAAREAGPRALADGAAGARRDRVQPSRNAGNNVPSFVCGAAARSNSRTSSSSRALKRASSGARSKVRAAFTESSATTVAS